MQNFSLVPQPDVVGPSATGRSLSERLCCRQAALLALSAAGAVPVPAISMLPLRELWPSGLHLGGCASPQPTEACFNNVVSNGKGQ